MTEGFSDFIWRTLAPGARVVVGEGPLQGLRGTVVGTDDENGRVIVAVTLLRTSLPVNLDPTEMYLDDEVSERELVKH